MRRWISRAANLFRRHAAEREMRGEIASHLALLQEEFERRGLAPEEAARMARRALGGVERAKELHREARSFAWVEQFVRDCSMARVISDARWGSRFLLFWPWLWASARPLSSGSALAWRSRSSASSLRICAPIAAR